MHPHEKVLGSILEAAFPVGSVRWIARPHKRIGTEADLLYGLSRSATLGGTVDAAAPISSIDQAIMALCIVPDKFEPSKVPFYSTGSLLGDCAMYCTVGNPSLPSLLAPRLSPRRMCLDAIVFIPGYEAKDLKALVLANLLKHLPHCSGHTPPEEAMKVARYKRESSYNNDRLFTDFGLRILSDCIELAVSDGESYRTSYIGFANPLWSVTALNSSTSESERSSRRNACGFSRETIRRSLPAPILEASRMLSRYSRRVLDPSDMQLSPTFWLHLAMLRSARFSNVPHPLFSDTVPRFLADAHVSPPPDSQWTAEDFSDQSATFRNEVWRSLREQRPVIKLPYSFHFDIVTEAIHTATIASTIAENVVSSLRVPKMRLRNTSMLPVEYFFAPSQSNDFRNSMTKLINAVNNHPPNFLSIIDD